MFAMRLLIYFLAVFLLLAGCAVQSKPQGGPRDETPPSMVSQSPEQGALHFNGSEATVVFDEYIQARDLRNAMVATPPLEGLEAEIKGKRLLVRWDEQELRKQTTYRLTFGDAIGDLNENNTYSNLEVVTSILECSLEVLEETSKSLQSQSFHAKLALLISKSKIDSYVLKTPDKCAPSPKLKSGRSRSVNTELL